MLENVYATYARQKEIGDDDIVALPGEQTQGLFTGSNRVYIVAFTLKKQSKAFAATWFVIYEQNSGGMVHDLKFPLSMCHEIDVKRKVSWKLGACKDNESFCGMHKKALDSECMVQVRESGVKMHGALRNICSNKGNYYQLFRRVGNRTVFCLTLGRSFCLDCQLVNGVSI